LPFAGQVPRNLRTVCPSQGKFPETCGEFALRRASSPKLAGSLPFAGQVPRNLRTVCPSQGKFPETCGEFALRRASSPKLAADLPRLGQLPRNLRGVCPSRGKFPETCGEFALRGASPRNLQTARLHRRKPSRIYANGFPAIGKPSRIYANGFSVIGKPPRHHQLAISNEQWEESANYTNYADFLIRLISVISGLYSSFRVFRFCSRFSFLKYFNHQHLSPLGRDSRLTSSITHYSLLIANWRLCRLSRVFASFAVK
jgi:hypothetical protein